MKYKRPIGGIIFDILNVTFMILFCISIIYPFMRQLTISLSPAEEVIRKSLKLYPTKITLMHITGYLKTNSFCILLDDYMDILGTVLHLHLLQ